MNSDRSEVLEDSIKKQIAKDRQIMKFSAYGFLKNLAFFKPFLLIYLISHGVSIFQIGILYAIRETVIYLFEVPSGIIADYYGRKKELYMCFSFYIISFVIFFFTSSFIVAALAMVFFGLGEAFRSGTHKAMILTYLEKNSLKKYKTLVYGRTRSFSLIGTAISSLISIFIMLALPSSGWIFLASIIPYILDFILISTYPKYLDRDEDAKPKEKLSKEVKSDLKSIFKNAPLRGILINQGLFTAVTKTIKDMLQPILKIIILSSGAAAIFGLENDSAIIIILGISYSFINVICAISSRNAYRLKKLASSTRLMNLSFLFLGLTILGISAATYISAIIPIIILFLFLNMINDTRKPIYVDAVDEHMDKKTRATVMSIENQITGIATVIIAPVFGYLADNTGLDTALLIIGISLTLVSLLLKYSEKKR